MCERRVPFEKVSESYRCPQCLAPKRRFVPYDVRSGKVRKRLWPVDKVCLVVSLLCCNCERLVGMMLDRVCFISIL